MTRDEYIFKNAAKIVEQRIRVARKLQAEEAERKWKEGFGAIKSWCTRWKRALLGGKSLTS